MQHLEKAKEVIRIESQVIADLENRIDQNFHKAVEIILSISGKVIVMGMGKSGLVGRKLSATLSSTGTPSFFMHPGEAAHGDLGGLSERDLLLLVSNSGETGELIQILPNLKRRNIPILGIFGNINSTLANSCDVALDTSVKKEACPMGIVPTASSIAASAMGDALAISLLDKRGFEEKDFAEFHPGGSLGKRLLTTVEDLMNTGNTIPLISRDKAMKEVIVTMTQKSLGIVGLLDSDNNLVGAISDGDLRRSLESGTNVLEKKASELMTKTPKWITKDRLAIDALQTMEKFAITSLFVFCKENKGIPIGIIHIHDILKYGIGT
ncbi:MAG: KpsF/GutQ family sugar-phosphate isomerase [Candidatus Marinimicrobia bacterium]|nr:KpsF/GutQ family sugar-phosphate isomerase [Candidatus Neomarinimicrobiota bacterium]